MKNRFWSIILVVCCVFVFTATDYQTGNRTSHLGSLIQNALSKYTQWGAATIALDLNTCELQVYTCHLDFGEMPSDMDRWLSGDYKGLPSYAVYPDGTSIKRHYSGWTVMDVGWNYAAISAMWRARL